MAEFANLPSRLFHILFGQSPRERKEAAAQGNSRLTWLEDTKAALSTDCLSVSFTAAGKCLNGCQLQIKEVPSTVFKNTIAEQNNYKPSLNPV